VNKTFGFFFTSLLLSHKNFYSRKKLQKNESLLSNFITYSKIIKFSSVNTPKSSTVLFNSLVLDKKFIPLSYVANLQKVAINTISSNLSVVQTKVLLVSDLSSAFKNSFSTNVLSINYFSNNVAKHIEVSSFKNYFINFLRRTKIFNKGRYSRNRQTCRSVVYWCLYLSIILFIGLYY
jgi:hypothetical protein